MAALIAGGPGDNGDDDLSELLRKILALDELKIDTPAVRKIKDVLAQFMLYNGTEKAQLQLLVDTRTTPFPLPFTPSFSLPR